MPRNTSEAEHRISNSAKVRANPLVSFFLAVHGTGDMGSTRSSHLHFLYCGIVEFLASPTGLVKCFYDRRTELEPRPMRAVALCDRLPELDDSKTGLHGLMAAVRVQSQCG